MDNDQITELLTRKDAQKKKSRTPARLDLLQSATGLLLAIFIIFHMLFESSILVSKDFMHSVTKAFELSFIFEGGSGIPVFVLAVIVSLLFIFHAFLAMRKFPISYKEAKRLKTHSNLLNHGDTKLWIVQATTGFALFFLGSVHIYTVLTNPSNIGPYASSDRVYSDWMWPLYMALLFIVVIHACIGLYRLAMKWGWFDQGDGKKSRAKAKKAMIALTLILLTLGVMSILTYMKIGYEHQAHYGEKYQTEQK